MPSQQHYRPSQTFTIIRPIRCPLCDGAAHIARRSPHPSFKSAEQRVFECWTCGNLIRCVAERE